jgi:FkbM family methyltransferase
MRSRIIQGAQKYYAMFGSSGVFLGAMAWLLRRPLEVSVSVSNLAYSVRLRLMTTDVNVFRDVILDAQYEKKFSKPPRVIVDAGANIGLASVFYANAYPQAKIIALEPESSNYEMLKKNVAPYRNVLPIKAALWKQNKEIYISNSSAKPWGFRTTDEDQGVAASIVHRVRGITVDRLMEEEGIDYIDILKVDIEGSEKEVFEHSAAWIDKIGTIMIELHDRFKPGCSQSVYAATCDFQKKGCHGEITFLMKSEYAPKVDHKIEEKANFPLYSPTQGRKSHAHCKLQLVGYVRKGSCTLTK